jgi:hypothetical protein
VGWIDWDGNPFIEVCLLELHVNVMNLFSFVTDGGTLQAIFGAILLFAGEIGSLSIEWSTG